MKLIMTFLTSCIMISSLSAATLSGNVADAMTGEDLIGANISVFQNAVFIAGTVSDIDGEYQVELGAGEYEIEVSYIGFETQKVTVFLSALDENKDLTIELEQGITLAEVVITEYEVPPIEHVISCGGYSSTCGTSCMLINIEGEKVEVKEEEIEESFIKIFDLNYYPNPTTDLLNVVLTQATKSLIIRSMDGKELSRHSNLLEGTVSLDVSNYAAGTYILQVEINGEMKAKKFMVSQL